MGIQMRNEIFLGCILFISICSLIPQSVSAAAKDDPLLTKVMIDQFEVRDTDEDRVAVLEAQAWFGHDINKLWFKTELERFDTDTDEAEVTLLYSRAFYPYWDVQIGLRKDFQPTPDRTWGVLGFQGLSPYFFEIDTALFLGESGRLALRLEAEYELMITQRLVISPELELNFHAQNDESVGTGSGLSDAEAGLRLRYEISREFAPYIGVNWVGAFGHTADFKRLEGEGRYDSHFVMGIRGWF